jgi:hypothetical protein
MALQRSRSLLLGLGLSMALGLVVAFPAAGASMLTGETLNGASSQGNSGECLYPTYSVSGTATGPYPGTFTETGTWSVWNPFIFSATFNITSGTTTITGSKTAPLSYPENVRELDCGLQPPDSNRGSFFGIPYTATIQSPSGNLHDQGVSVVDAAILGAAATLTESFTSTLAPTSKDQCKNGGWRNYPQFKNQGQCERSL